MIFITDDDVVLETVPKDDCEGCYFNKGGFECDSPLPRCCEFGNPIIWKPISNKTKNKLMSLLTNKEQGVVLYDMQRVRKGYFTTKENL